MKSKHLFLIPLFLSLAPASCRTERKTASSAYPEETKSESVPSLSPPAPSVPNATSAVEDSDKTRKELHPPASRERSAEEIFAQMDKEKRAEVFDVPVSGQVARDRAEAWEKLTTPEPHVRLKKEQYLYVQQLLERYHDAPVPERLVFWRLLDLRLHDQRVSHNYVVLGDDYRQLRIDMDRKLMAMLYSALGEDPAKLPDFLAVRKGIEALKQAAKNPPPPGK